MKHTQLLFTGILATILFSGCSILGIRTSEEAPYTEILREGEFEIREYSDYLSAETTVSEKDWDKASRIGFKRLAKYIFGGNQQKQKISMTAPVIMAEDSASDNSESISMTAPVLAQKTNLDGWKMEFVLPSKLNLENAPTPLDPEVTLRQKSGKKYTVKRFSGFLSEDKLEEYSKDLRDWMKMNKLTEVSPPVLAGYDPPWTIPFLRRNEVLIEIQ